MQVQDRWGLDTTTEDADAVARLDHLVDGFVSFAADTPERLKDAVSGQVAPLAHIAFGYLIIQSHTRADHLRASDAAGRARQLDLNDRERLHLSALDMWLSGDVDATNDILDSILERWPTDMLAVRLQHFRLFNRGRLDDMLRSARRSIDAWGDLPRRSYLDGMTAFALEELGDYAAAEALGRQASEADPADLWSVHSVAHVLEMQGRGNDGLAWFDGRDDVLRAHGSFARHLWWHHAIIHLRSGNIAAILEMYDADIDPGDAVDGLSLTNAIDVLARLEFSGANVGDRWSGLVDGSSYRIGYHDAPFNDAHYAYALTRAGADTQAADLISGMEAWQDRSGTAADVISTVGLSTAQGMAALGAGRVEEAASLLRGGADDRWQLGGSHAQRFVFDLAQKAAEDA